MKGVVFTTFYDFCEKRFGEDTLDRVIEAAKLPHAGAYTAVGTYPFEEMVALVSAASQLVGEPLPVLLESFGAHCVASWVTRMPSHFDGKDLFDVLANLDHFHENEVRRLYPDAEIPSFQVASRDPQRIELDYRSCKPLADLAAGAIRGASEHLATPVTITRCPVGGASGDAVRFAVTKASPAR